MLLELPSDFGSELSKYINETADPGLRDGALISLDQIVRIPRLPRSRDHSRAECSNVWHKLWPQMFLTPVIGHKISHDSMASARPESFAFTAVRRPSAITQKRP
jgi:hypothetical protein